MSVNWEQVEEIERQCSAYHAEWVAVTKMQTLEDMRALYHYGKRLFGENKAQEIERKYPLFPADVQWHFIGHLQRNKVKSIIDKVAYIHSVDSLRLLDTIQQEASKIDKKINVLIQIHIAEEETKYGFSIEEASEFFDQLELNKYPHVRIKGLMAMASMTDDRAQIRREFASVRKLMDTINQSPNLQLEVLSMGMSSDYTLALDEGATMLRIGSIIFGG